jgi:hypothetical protein
VAPAPLPGSRERNNKVGLLFSFWWAVGKERNRRIFDHEELPAHRVAVMAGEDAALYGKAVGAEFL